MNPHSYSVAESCATDPRLDRVASKPGDDRAVAVVQVVLSLGTGGTERLVLELCRRLALRFRLAVCTLDEPGIWAKQLRELDIPVTPLHRRSGFRPSLGYRIAQIARHHRASVIHCHHYSPFIYGVLATLMKPGLRMVFTEHGRLSDGPPSPKRRLLNPVFGRVPGSMFAVSHALRHSMIDEGFPAGRLQVVHNGIDCGNPPSEFERRATRRRLGLSDTALIVGTVARLDPVKDLGTLIQSFALLRQTLGDAELVVVGDGCERQHLEQAARQSGVLQAVRFLGQRDDARRLLPAFDVYVNSSTSEGVSLTILEAMAAGAAVVATRVGGTPEVIVDGVTGLLVPARSPSHIADAVRALALDPTRRRALGATARLAVRQHFTLDRMVEHYAQEYLRLAS